MSATAAVMETPQRVKEWAKITLQPAVERYKEARARAGETAFSLPAIPSVATRGRLQVVPTAVLIEDAVDRFRVAHHGEVPEAVIMSPLRLLAMARYNSEMYFVGDGAITVKLRARSGLEVDEVYGASTRVTQPIPAVD